MKESPQREERKVGSNGSKYVPYITNSRIFPKKKRVVGRKKEDIFAYSSVNINNKSVVSICPIFNCEVKDKANAGRRDQQGLTRS